MTTDAEKKCTPCQGGVEPLKSDQIKQRMSELSAGWRAIDDKRIEKEWSFKNFQQTWNFVCEVAELAEEEDHHPTVCFTYGQATVTLWTHKIDGLHDNDFILAAKIDRL